MFNFSRILRFDYTLTGFTDESLAAAVQFVEGGLYGAEGEAPESSAQEIDPDDYEMDHRCPRCGFEFDDRQT